MTSPQRIRLPSMPEIHFLVSPVIEGLHAFDLIAMVDDWGEGFAPWVYRIRAALSSSQYEQLTACNHVMPWTHVLSFIHREGGLSQTFGELILRLHALQEEELAGLVSSFLRREANGIVSTDTVARVKRHLTKEHPHLAVSDSLAHRVIKLLQNPGELKSAYIATLENLLEQHLSQRWEQDQPVLQQEVARQIEQLIPRTLPSWIEAVTGRSVPVDDLFCRQRTILAMPTTYLGPFITLSLLPNTEDTLLLIYGLRGANSSSVAPTSSTELASAGFKALGDETRLRILQMTAKQEMYAHEIGSRFTHVGQPAVSRHLRYLADKGFLNVRDAQAKKFYSLNRVSIINLRTQLDHLLAAVDNTETSGSSQRRES